MQSIEINVKVTIGMETALLGVVSDLMSQRTAHAELPASKLKERVKAAEEKPKEYTEIDVRAAMNKVRCRIEGENYKEQPDSEGYKKWHKILTSWFKDRAAFCGAEKPSLLPDSNSRYKFIQCCENVKVVNDELVEDCSF